MLFLFKMTVKKVATVSLAPQDEETKMKEKNRGSMTGCVCVQQTFLAWFKPILVVCMNKHTYTYYIDYMYMICIYIYILKWFPYLTDWWTNPTNCRNWCVWDIQKGMFGARFPKRRLEWSYLGTHSGSDTRHVFSHRIHGMIEYLPALW